MHPTRVTQRTGFVQSRERTTANLFPATSVTLFHVMSQNGRKDDDQEVCQDLAVDDRTDTQGTESEEIVMLAVDG